MVSGLSAIHRDHVSTKSCEMNTDLEQAIKYALEDEDPSMHLQLCPHCGTMKFQLGEHVCRTNPLEFVGQERDDHKRARSYAIE